MRISESEYHHLLAQSGQPLPQDVQEKRFLAQVVRLARDLGYVAYHVLDSRGSTAGFPDVVLADPIPSGRRPGGDLPIFMCELKTQRGKLTHEQELWLRSLDGKRVVAEIWRPGDMAEIVARLRGEQ